MLSVAETIYKPWYLLPEVRHDGINPHQIFAKRYQFFFLAVCLIRLPSTGAKVLCQFRQQRVCGHRPRFAQPPPNWCHDFLAKCREQREISMTCVATMGRCGEQVLGCRGKFPIILGVFLYGIPSPKHGYWDMNPIAVSKRLRCESES